MKKLTTVKQLANENPAFSEASIRHLIFKHAPLDRHNTYSDHALQNAVIRIGRKVVIDEERFYEGLRAINLRQPT